MSEKRKLPIIQLEEYLQNDRPNRCVLSIQSHAVSGSVGNKCAVFPLKLHNYAVHHIESVQFSNHTQYENGALGQNLSGKELHKRFEGPRRLKTNYSHVLTGYCGDASFLRKLASIVQECRQQQPDLIYVCDPVMGDNGPTELRDIYWN